MATRTFSPDDFIALEKKCAKLEAKVAELTEAQAAPSKKAAPKPEKPEKTDG